MSSHAKKATIRTDDPEKIFTLIEKLGEGSYGSVWKAQKKSTGELFAVKRVPIEEDIETIRAEINILKECQNPYIVKYDGCYAKGMEELWMVMEFCGAGSVADMMTVCDKPLTEAQIAVVTRNILKGLDALHSPPLRKIHRDIKAGNILINDNGEAKLADFGITGNLTRTVDKRKTVIGTPYWMAPEVIQEVGYNQKADIWSLGITLIEMAETRPPYSEMHPMRAIFQIPTRPPPTLTDPTKWSADFNNFISKCLIKDPAARWSAAQLLKHPFVEKAGSSALLKDLIVETMAKIQELGRETALRLNESSGSESGSDSGTGTGTGTGSGKRSSKAYHSSGSSDDEGNGTMVRRDGSDEEGSGTMVRHESSDEETPKKPSFMSHFESPAEKQLAVYSTEQLIQLRDKLVKERDAKIQEIRDKYAKMKLPTK